MNRIVCRCCLSSEVVAAFKDMLTESISVKNSKTKIFDYFLIFSGVEKNYLNSTRICQDCELKLRNAFEFRELIICTNIKIEEEDMTIKDGSGTPEKRFFYFIII
jgi:hypothetical protein